VNCIETHTELNRGSRESNWGVGLECGCEDTREFGLGTSSGAWTWTSRTCHIHKYMMNATTTAYLNAMVPLRTAEKSRDQLDNSHSDVFETG
jgi:hypothetical protein